MGVSLKNLIKIVINWNSKYLFVKLINIFRLMRTLGDNQVKYKLRLN